MLYQALVAKIYDEWINFSSTSLNQNTSACAIYRCACLQAKQHYNMTIVYSKLFSQVSEEFQLQKKSRV